MRSLRTSLAALFKRTGQAVCDNCAFVEHFRSNGDGQVSRLHTFCRCPGGPHQDRPVPPARTCSRWQRRGQPVDKPVVGDSNLTV